MDSLLISNIALWFVVCVLSLLVFALMRQIGVLHERVFPAGALMTQQGIMVGDQVSPTTITTLSGNQLTVGEKNSKDTLLLFVSPDCPICKTLIPITLSVTKKENNVMNVFFISDIENSDEQKKHQQFIAKQGIAPDVYALSRSLGLQFLVDKLPFAAIIDSSGILRAKGIVNSREHLESLFEAQAKGVASLQEYLSHA